MSLDNYQFSYTHNCWPQWVCQRYIGWILNTLWPWWATKQSVNGKPKFPWVVITETRSHMKCQICTDIQNKFKLTSVWATDGSPNFQYGVSTTIMSNQRFWYFVMNPFLSPKYAIHFIVGVIFFYYPIKIKITQLLQKQGVITQLTKTLYL